MNSKLTIVGLVLVTGLAAAAKTTTPRQPDYSAFRIISQQNIFNQYRVAHHHDKGQTVSTTPARVGDAFSLVGTMSYAKGDFAFFNGTNPEFRKIVRPEGAIADYKVTEITPQSVTLESDGKKIELKVGAQMRRDEQGAWKSTASGEPPGMAAGSAVASPAESAGGSSGGDANEVLKKLMQKREQELK